MNWLLGFVLIVLLALAFGGEEALKGLLTVLLAIAGVIALWFVSPRISDKKARTPPVPARDFKPPLSERDMVELLASYPQELLGEPLMPEGREVCIDNCRLDLLFRKGPGRLVAVEVKPKRPNREDIRQVLEYAIVLKDEEREEYPGEWVRLLLVAPSINPVDKRTLKNQYIGWREIPQERFLEVARGHGHL